jgi:REP-associated tyrosine transposase
MPGRRLRRPVRLPHVPYIGMRRYSLTLCTCRRHEWFVDPTVLETARSQLLQHARDFGFAVPAYCFMPDHLHVLAEGQFPDSNLKRFMNRFKQDSGFRFGEQRNHHLWQKGYYDRILRDDEPTIIVARYIFDNPVRVGLVTHFDQYPGSGSTCYTMCELADALQSIDKSTHG